MKVPPFRFGVVTTGGTAESRSGWASYARQVEALGFSVLQVADHYGNSTVCTPRLAVAAAATSELRVGSYVYDNDFRHPALLAREAAEIDVLSGGRMELGIGAGWVKEEYDQVGLEFDPGPVRAARYEEAVLLVRKLHSAAGPISHEGEFYRLQDYDPLVRPAQQPVPLLLGGGGPRMIRFAAAQADTIAFAPRSLPGGGLDPTACSAAAFHTTVTVLERALETAGRPVAPERAVLVLEMHAHVGDVPENGWAPREAIVDGPFGLVGDTAQMVDTLISRRQRWGLSFVTCWEEDLDLFAPVVAQLAGT